LPAAVTTKIAAADAIQIFRRVEGRRNRANNHHWACKSGSFALSYPLSRTWFGRSVALGLYCTFVMNRPIKRIAEMLLPRRIFVTIQSIRSRNYQQQLLKEWGVYQSTVEVAAQYGRTILDGPFRGMKYPIRALLNRHGIPILFGTYELELHPIIEEVTSRRYNRIIDIGCAEGYYAVGLARKTEATIYAFDCEPRERYYCRRMARENGVADRVHVGDWCSTRTLRSLAIERCLVIADCEGYEVQLFSDDVVAALKSCDLIIELHEVPGMDVRAVLLERFLSTHDARLITFEPNSIGSVPERWRRFAREIRPPGQQWAFLTPHF
jgi:hypothetical protein